MSIYKRQNSKYWWMSFRFDGKHVQKSTKCKNKRDAEAIERAYRTQLAKGEVGFKKTIKPPRFSDAMDEFLSWVEVEHRAKPNTVLSYFSTSRALARFFRERRIDEINPGDVERFKQWRSKQKRLPRAGRTKGSATRTKTLSPATINRELALLKIFFNFYIKRENLFKNPVTQVKMLKEEPPKIRILTSDEERLYLLAAKQPLQDVATIMADTGMRPEEVFRIEKENVNLSDGYVFNPHGKTRSARRIIPLTERTRALMKSRIHCAKEDYLFLNEKTGKPITTLKTAHAGAIKRSGIEHFRLYDLRHTFATRFVESGGDIMTLKDLLGHSSIQMVTRYAHPTEKHKFEAIRKMEATTQTYSHDQDVEREVKRYGASSSLL